MRRKEAARLTLRANDSTIYLTVEDFDVRHTSGLPYLSIDGYLVVTAGVKTMVRYSATLSFTRLGIVPSANVSVSADGTLAQRLCGVLLEQNDSLRRLLQLADSTSQYVSASRLALK